jgi:hypothetical protein
MTLTASLINIKTLTDLSELRPFFFALSSHNRNTYDNNNQFDCCDSRFDESQIRDSYLINGSSSYETAIDRLDHSLYVDFAEHWQL